MQVFICVGILVAYLVGLPYRDNLPQHAYIGGSDVAWWRIMLAFGLIPAALQVLCLLLLNMAEARSAIFWSSSCACCILHQLILKRYSIYIQHSVL